VQGVRRGVLGRSGSAGAGSAGAGRGLTKQWVGNEPWAQTRPLASRLRCPLPRADLGPKASPLLFFIDVSLMSQQRLKRLRTHKTDAAAVQVQLPGRDQLLLKSPELQSRLGSGAASFVAFAWAGGSSEDD
jgi:hypothetical protein